MCPNESFASGREYACRGREGINLLVHACYSTLFVSSYWFSIFSPFLLFLILFFSSFSTYPSSRLWFSLQSYYCCFVDPPLMHGKGPLYIACRDWLFTILAFNYLCLVWVSLPTIIGLSIVQPPPLACAGCAIPYYQTKKIILFACSSWRYYPPWCGNLFCYPSWHAPSGSNSSLLRLSGMPS